MFTTTAGAAHNRFDVKTGTDLLDVRTAVQAVGMMLGVKDPDAAAEGIDAEERRQRIGAALRRIEERLAQDRPLVIVVEDVHWADSASWDVFLELLAQATEKPILGIATARPDDRAGDSAPARAGAGRCSQVRAQRFSHRST